MSSSMLQAIETDRRKAPKSRTVPPDTQQVCIDLPGEQIRCYVYKKKLEVMLRKHRDVIFDIALFKEMQYSVEADQSDFFSVRDKKIVLKAQRQKVLFADGERLHLHVGRNFRGSLILKANGKVLNRYQPGSLDCTRYDDEPSNKPAPLIVVMKNQPVPALATKGPEASPWSLEAHDPMMATHPWASTRQAARFIQSQEAVPPGAPEQTMHIIEVQPGVGAMPQEIADFFKNGGEDTAVDPNKLMTRNWLWAQIAGAAGFASDNKHWIGELWKQRFYLQRVVHKSGPKYYIVFSGPAGWRSYLTASRYGAANTKVVAISGGAGSATGLRHAAWEATKGSVRKGGLLVLLFTITLDTAEWLADHEQRDPTTGKPKKDVFDLCFKVGVDVIKAGLSAAVASIVVGALVWTATAIAAAAGIALAVPGLVLIVGVVAVSVVAGLVLDMADKKTGTTDALNKGIRNVSSYLEEKLPTDYGGYDKSMEVALQFGLGA